MTSFSDCAESIFCSRDIQVVSITSNIRKAERLFTTCIMCARVRLQVWKTAFSSRRNELIAEMNVAFDCSSACCRSRSFAIFSATSCEGCPVGWERRKREWLVDMR